SAGGIPTTPQPVAQQRQPPTLHEPGGASALTPGRARSIQPSAEDRGCVLWIPGQPGNLVVPAGQLRPAGCGNAAGGSHRNVGELHRDFGDSCSPALSGVWYRHAATNGSL